MSNNCKALICVPPNDLRIFDLQGFAPPPPPPAPPVPVPPPETFSLSLSFDGVSDLVWTWGGIGPTLWIIQHSDSSTGPWTTVGSSPGAVNAFAIDQSGFYKVYGVSPSGRGVTPDSNVLFVPHAPPPPFTIQYPVDGQTISGSITLSCSLIPNMVSVSYYFDAAVLVGTASVSPFSLPFDTTSMIQAVHTFYAVATLADSSTVTSQVVTVTVSQPFVQPVLTFTP